MLNLIREYEIAQQQWQERLVEIELHQICRQARQDRAKAQFQLLVTLGRRLRHIGQKLFKLMVRNIPKRSKYQRLTR